MKQTTRSLVGLLVLLVVGGAVAVAAAWTGRDEEQKAEQKEKSEKLFEFDQAKAVSLRLEKDGKLVAQAVREEKGWKLTEPGPGEADAQAINGLLGQLATLKQKKDLGEEKDLKAFGLDAPRLFVSVKLQDGSEHGLSFGIDNSFDNTMYVKKAKDPLVRIVDGYVKSSFDKSLFDLREKRVAHLDEGEEVRRVDVSAVAKPYLLEKDGAAWKVAGGAADGAAADKIVAALKGLRAIAIPAEKLDAPARFGLEKPRLVVKLGVGPAGAKELQARTISFGQAKGEGNLTRTYAARSGSLQVFEVDGQILGELEKQPFDLQDKQLLHFTRDDVRKLALESPGGPRLEIARTKEAPAAGGPGDERFVVLAPQKGPAKKGRVSSALYSLAALRAAASLGPLPRDPKQLAALGLAQPRVLSLFADGDKLLARLKLGAERDGKRVALPEGGEQVYLVEKGAVDELPWALADALETAPAAVAPKAESPPAAVAPKAEAPK